MFEKLKKRLQRRRRFWESLCDQCGLCCYRRHRGPQGEVVIDYARPCRFLDTESGLCYVYEDRFEMNPECRKVTIYNAKFDRLMPQTCGYVRAYRKRS